MKLRSLPIASALLAFCAASVAGQAVPFGKNKVQYQDFEWRVLSGEHVDVYYYPQEETVARLALAYAEESWTELERAFQHHPFRRVPLIVYSSDQHFEQTNVYPGFIPEGVLGFTEYLKRRVALPFRGDYDQFRKTLRHELVHSFQLSKIAESAVRFPRSRSFSPQQIHWWTEGLAEFLSGEQTTEDEMYVRDVVVGGRLPTIEQFGRLYSFASYPLGAELHHYLSERFGPEYIVNVYEQYRGYDSFEQTLEGVLGIDLEQLSREWKYALEQRYYPTFAARPPLDVAARSLAGDYIAFKPLVYAPPGDTAAQLLFLAPNTGYTNLYRQPLAGGAARTVLEGERSPEFESLHFTESGLDVHEDGTLALVSKFNERDALVLWDLHRDRMVGRYQWEDLVGLKSPSWDPTGRRIVFEGLSAAGFSDLYIFDFDTQQRRALTADRYRDSDPDWSPDGARIVFASDRSPFGEAGRTNLVLIELDSGRMRYLTWGDWNDLAPRWSRAGDRIAFTSDRAGFFDLYVVDSQGRGNRATSFSGGAFDAEWLPGDRGFVFSGFEDGTYRAYRFDLPPGAPAGPVVALEAPNGGLVADADGFGAAGVESAPAGGWSWSDLDAAVLDEAETRPYAAFDKLTVDFAGGDAIVSPGVGTAQGIQFLMSDMLGDHMVFAGISAIQATDFSRIADSFSGNLMYLNLSHRLNYGVGVFRFKGLFRDVALDLYEETTWGGYFLASYPFSKFHRVELQLGLEHSDRFDTEDAYEDGLLGNSTRFDPRDLTRRGLLASNYLSYVKDNTLWLPTGPIDGERFNVTAGVVNCFACESPSPVTGRIVERGASAENYILLADYRRYFRTSMQSAYAIRAFAFYSDGAIPARGVLGGPSRLRGYPRFSLAGSRLWLLNQEWRFPLLNSLDLNFPVGTFTFPGIQAALFADLGSSWLESQKSAEGAWGSYGIGFRTSLGPPLVLRLDVGRRFRIGDPPPVVFRGRESFNDTFVDFYIGFNY